ncbi:hypothetical protein Pmani_027800 [Petrolisthes manimaculis]|uniref:Ig-like domain-containing protein n=1 Tax=Petrolisthes manimaculis TaxID=1843537 RepID=A0AAE1NI62_9EUCA|nr:hypothetical protein Pmani_037188 [Petrolisthes manimaculis]KAK4299966.1 hypothetical protein Pmani_027800 [Petrolisthes manimaculis]
MPEAELVSGKALWGVICGTYALPSDEVVGAELQAATILRTGIRVYQKPTPGDYDTWAKSSKVSQTEKTFVKKISEKLNLCASQSWEVFQLFLVNEYSGSEAALAEVLSSQRDQEAFLDHLLRFYMADRLYLLRCLRHIVASTADPLHPYQSLFRDFLRDVLDKDGGLGESVVQQVLGLSKQEIPHPTSSLWLAHHLAELQEGLATLLVYYSSTTITPPPSTFISLLHLIQGNGPGGRVEVQEQLRDTHTSLLAALDATHALLLVLAVTPDTPTSGHSLCEKEWIEKVEPVMGGLGSRPAHLAPLLAWCVLQLRSPNPPTPHVYHKLAQRALTGNVFGYLQEALDCPAIKGDALVLGVASSVVYSLVCAAASCLTLDNLPCLTSLAKTCLAQDPPAQLFWSEEGGGAGLLLPQALEMFPHEPEPLLSLSTALAKASTYSCNKVVELLSELPGLTCLMNEANCQLIGIRKSDGQCRATGAITLMPTVTVPRDTCGALVSLTTGSMVVSWHFNVSGWQVLLSCISTLDQQVSSGVNVVEPRTMKTVCLTLRLLASVLATVPSHLPALVHFTHQTLALLRRVSQVWRPPGELVAAMMEMLAEAAAERPAQVWNELEGNQLLPSLPLTASGSQQSRGGEQHYQAGRLRALVCGEEAAAGSYPILTAYTRLLTAAIKGGVAGASVRGGVVFLAREVAGPLLRWCFKSQEERDSVLHATLAPLHHTLQHSSVDPELRDLVVRQLVDQSSAGQTLLWVVVGGAGLEATLSHPTHSPASINARRLTRTAQMALSILHRLVGEESSIDGLSQLLRATPSPRTGLAAGVTGAGAGAGTSSNPPHLALTVALYAHHRLNPRLTYLALRTLTRFAQKLEVPLVACLGGEAEGVRDALLRRLDSPIEDVGVKVALLRLLTAATTRQQGLTNAFLTPPHKLLGPLVSLVAPMKRNEAGQEVQLAVVELVDALWSEKYSTAIQHLHNNKHFWSNLVHPLVNQQPGEVRDAIVCHTLRVLARQLFLSDAKPTTALKGAVDQLCEPVILSKWSKHVVGNVKMSGGELVGAWRDLLGIMVARAGAWLTDTLKVKLAKDVLGALHDQLESDSSNEELTTLLAELYLLLVRHCGKLLAENSEFFGETSQLLVWLQGAVMVTSPHCQMLLLAAALTVLTLSHPSQGECEQLVCASASLAHQHGRLAGVGSRACTSPSTLALATAVLHQCLLQCPPDANHLRPILAPVVPALLHSTDIYIKSGDEEVVGELLSLLATLSQIPHLSEELLAGSLCSTLTLIIPPSKTLLLSKVVWGLVWRVKEEGVGGVEGGVNVAAVHLPALCESLSAPHRQPGLALATAALTAALAPHVSLWMVLHAESQTQLTAAVTRCIHLTTHLLCLPRVVQLELRGGSENKSSSTTSEGGAIGAITPSIISVLNSMLQVLSACLSALCCLGPDLTDLLCGAGPDVAAWTLFFHPSFRRVAVPDPNAQPSLASLTSVLELYDSHASKESRGVSPCRSGAPEVSLCVRMLARCAEQALLLLLTQCSLTLMSPDIPPRDALRVRHGLADEMNSFFTRWLGRRLAVSPLPSTSAAASGGTGSAHMDIKYLRLAQQLVGRLSATK